MDNDIRKYAGCDGCDPILFLLVDMIMFVNLTSQGSRGTDVDCHAVYQTFRANRGPSLVVDQRYMAW